MGTELTYQKITFTPNAEIEVKFDHEVIRRIKMRFLLIEDKVILGVTALQNKTNYEILQMQTYLKALGLSIGLLANFGKSQLELRGIKG
jgi:GxxExxY protein